MKAKKQKVSLPIGRTALLAFQMNSLRDECCYAAEKMLQQTPLNEAELEECARLDDALAEAQQVLWLSWVADCAFSVPQTAQPGQVSWWLLFCPGEAAFSDGSVISFSLMAFRGKMFFCLSAPDAWQGMPRTPILAG